MLDSLKQALYDAVARSVPESSLGVAFSGGVDSALLAKLSSNAGKDVTLITVGFPGSHDLEFSSKIARMLSMRQRIVQLDAPDFRIKLAHVQQIIRCENTSHIENCVAYHYISAAARSEGLDVVMSANGCDELFCGYNGYRLAYSGGPKALEKLMDEKIANELLLVEEISAVAEEFGVSVRQPFLDREFISFAKTIPLQSKITGPDDMIRKHILRQVALDLQVPKESALKPKKALQYGSLIHRNFQAARKGLVGNLD